MITKEQFLVRQPSMPEETATDAFYLETARALAAAARGIRAPYAEALLDRVALCLTGYYQDVIADAGLWRGFINECRRLYGFTIPFHEPGDNYIDYEINLADVRFLTWYALAMNDESLRYLYPHDAELLRLADRMFEVLEERYDDAPVPEDYNLAFELDMFDPEDADAILRLGNWLFLHSYLLTPAYALTLAGILADPGLTKDRAKLAKALELSMAEDTTGPLALYLREWTFLTVADRMPPKPRKKADEKEPHKYYQSFIKATGGRDIAYFATYDDLNRFLVEGLGWPRGERHLEVFAEDSDFVLMVNPEKGLLAARNVARCIANPDNPLYDKAYASTHAFGLLSERGLCPGDLLRRILNEEWLPDAAFPGSVESATSPETNRALVAENADFIARCYLQNFYRGD